MALPPTVDVTDSIPVIQPPRLSLVSAAGPNVPPADDHWLNGIKFRRDECGEADLTWDCTGPDGSAPAEKTVEMSSDIVTWRPYWAWYGVECPGWDSTENNKQRASNALLARESKQIADELWNGTVAQAADFENTWLADPTSVTDLSPGGASSPLVYALTALQEIAQDQPGRSMIHATKPTATLWLAAGAIRREGNLLLDAFDNIIVVDDGYDGAAPDGTIDITGETAYAYVTGLVTVWRGEIMSIPDNVGQAISTANNRVPYRAERPVLAFWDQCLHAGIRVNLCETCCASAGGS